MTTENASISCESAEIQLSEGSDGDGEVSGIHATGSVNLKQLGRECWADQLMWDANDSKVSLLGNARVMDDEWGEATGEKILLEKGKGRAQVIGGSQGRSKLSLPIFPRFLFLPKNERPSQTGGFGTFQNLWEEAGGEKCEPPCGRGRDCGTAWSQRSW